MLHIDSGGSTSDELTRLKESNVFSQVDHYAAICVFIFYYITCAVYCGGILRCDYNHQSHCFLLYLISRLSTLS